MRNLVQKLENGSTYLATVIEGSDMGMVSYSDFSDVPERFPTIMNGVLYERLVRRRVLVICGGGHISRPVCTLGAMLGYEVTVIDDRPEFACRERFPQAKEIRCESFASALQDMPEQASYVIVTRGHKDDALCLSMILKKSFAYCGMIGSRIKVAAVMKTMREQGFAEEQLANVHSPIGLKIGAHTPEEIAVSIAAELISVNSSQDSSVLPEEIYRKLCDFHGEMVMATIIRRQGSAPRGVGARMLICADGNVCGTIGGGAVEHAAIEHARSMIGSRNADCQTYALGGGEAAHLGMVCGGTIDVLFQPIPAETGDRL